MYKKSVMHVQSCCFASLNLLLFCRSCCRRRRRCLSCLLLSAPQGSRTLPFGLNYVSQWTAKLSSFFLRISKEIGKAWRKSLACAKRASLTRPKGVCGEKIFSVSPQSRSLFSASYRIFGLTASA